ncbi:MAG TPA: glycosyltransferase family 4 protein, partial [Pyrinomonadaceae bacterium]|nr:glycosyltransferase family 4 protein [Pyrinomonadaceae bacterium]
WLCCQLGAREHYAVPRALQTRGLLHELITDLWIRPGRLPTWRNKLTGRFHPDLAGVRVSAPNMAALAFELKSQATGFHGWDLIAKRNEWFQDHVLVQLERRASELGDGLVTVFAYSYAADRIFEFARERGWRTVLGQIDPGPAEERRVADSTPAPESYWRRWRSACDLADRILVNSEWSRDALLKEHLPVNKIHVIPLALEPGKDAALFNRVYPAAFDAARPLRVLFLGQINHRKGAAQLLDAARLLAQAPVEFWFVGPRQIRTDLRSESKIKWLGAVPRTAVGRFYREADIFILPTLSDGFGLTQLEAQSWKLPVLASRFCGAVVQHGRNGLILDQVAGESIAATLRELLESPERLAAMSQESRVSDEFTLKSLASSLTQL